MNNQCQRPTSSITGFRLQISADFFNPPNDLKEAGSDWKTKKGSVVRNPYILNFWRSFLSSIKSMK